MILSAIVYGAVAILMLGIGVSQLRSKEPVGFYSGEEPPKKEQLTDVNGWNKKHGAMWVYYGIIIIASWGLGYLMGDSIWSIIPMAGGIIVPVIVMIWYHGRLLKRYRK